MTKILMLGLSAIATLLVSKTASAHSDYWHCAARAGSVERAIRICGVRGPGGTVTGPIGRGGYGRGPYGNPHGGWGRGPVHRGPHGGWHRGPRGRW